MSWACCRRYFASADTRHVAADTGKYEGASAARVQSSCQIAVARFGSANTDNVEEHARARRNLRESEQRETCVQATEEIAREATVTDECVCAPCLTHSQRRYRRWRKQQEKDCPIAQKQWGVFLSFWCATRHQRLRELEVGEREYSWHNAQVALSDAVCIAPFITGTQK